MPDVAGATPELESEIEALHALGLPGLRAVWSKHWGCAPRLRSAKLLRLMIAWRRQAEVLGGLDPETRRRLKGRFIPRWRPPVGARLTKEHRGVLHRVEVGVHDFTYAGQSYASLSQIARAITGVRWNGPRFFGLRQPQ
jgi:hypothetical protein